VSRAIARALILLCLACPAAIAQEKNADAILILSQGHVAAGVGYSWAAGTLSYRSKTFPVKVQGLSVGEVGVIRADAAGSVYNLTRLADFDGSYTPAVNGRARNGGAGVTAVKNQHGVLIEMESITQGISLRLAAEGIRLSIGE